MNQPSDTRLTQDSCSYTEKLKRTIGPGLYTLNTPYNDCSHCENLPSDPALRFQQYGPNTCTMKSAIDDSSELLGINYKSSKCNKDAYSPGKYTATGGCDINSSSNPRQCSTPREDTRLSNPPSTLKGTGINRWEWLPQDPQLRAIEEFDRVPVNYRMVAKDNHVPIIEVPDDQVAFLPNYKSENLGDNMNKWNKGNAQNLYAPGNPIGSINYTQTCKNNTIAQ
jgi:hypothetical protein